MTKFLLSLAIDLNVLWAALVGLDLIFPGSSVLAWLIGAAMMTAFLTGVIALVACLVTATLWIARKA
jgi:hypothetical protein